MAERIDMSLDDIIKRDRIRSSGTRRGGIANKLGNRKAGGGGRPSRSLPVRKIGAVSRKMKTGVRRNSNNAVNKPANALNDKWVHDKFSEARTGALALSNLHYIVTNGDLIELFSNFGPLKKVSVHYDISGRSLGKADVVFFKAAHAAEAIKKYHGVTLDGRPMVIEYNVPNAVKTSIASRIGKAPVAKSKFQSVRRGGNVQNNQGKAGGAGQRRGGDGPRRGGGGRPGQRTGGRSRVPKKTPTQAELDADLDAFNIKME